MCCSALLIGTLSGIIGCEDDDDSSDEVTDNAPSSTEQNPDEQEPAANAPAQIDVSFAEVPLLRFLEQEETVVIRSQQEWDAYVARSTQYLFNPTIDPNDPHCDFATHMLVVYCFQPHDGCPWTYQGVYSVVIAASTTIVRANVDSKFIPLPDGPINDCQVVNVHEGFAVRIPQSDLPVEVDLNWY